MGSHVALIGAGALGSRHLQSLAGADWIDVVDVVEPSEAARATARERWTQIEGHAGKTLSFVPIEDLAPLYDAAVIATPAPGRLAILEQVLARAIPNILCEKVLFQSTGELARSLALVQAAGVDVRVNHVYRYAPPFAALAARIAGAPLDMSVTIGGDGMGCNLVHYLDLFTFLSGQALDTLSVSIDKPTHQAKRGPAYVEFTGSTRAQAANGGSLGVDYVAGEPKAPVFTLSWAEGTITISEADGAVQTTLAGLADQTFIAPRVSALTAEILAEQAHNACRLPTLAETAPINHKMLDAFNSALFGRVGDDVICPIT